MAKIVRVEMKPKKEILKRLNLEEKGKVALFFRDRVAIESDPYAPMVSGRLADYTTHGTEIWYEAPYAEYQYNGVREDGTHPINEANRNREKHPEATSRWVEKMWEHKKDKITREVQREIERLAKE